MLEQMSTYHPRRRWVRRLTLPFALGLLLTFVPLPKFSFVATSVVDRLPLPVLAEAGASQIEELQAASDEPISEDRVSGVEESVPEFRAIGVLFDEVPDEPVMVRVKGTDGGWQPWQELHVEGDEGPDAQPTEGPVESSDGGYGTAPFWAGEAVGYELSVGTSDAEQAEVALVRDDVQRTVAESTPLAGAAAPTPFNIRLRSEWGARPASTSVASTVRLAVVHHSVSSNSYSPSEVPAILRSIQAYHMDGRGWSDIAYNFVVDKYGGIWEGRGGGIDRPVIGAHAAGFNTGSVGVMVIGDYTQAQPNAAILESVSTVVGWKLALHNVDPLGSVAFTSGGSTKYPAGQVVNLPRVVGHMDVGLTSCPGSIQGSLDHIRVRSQEWTNFTRLIMGPQGSFDQLVGGADGTLTAVGWAVDLDVTGPSDIVMYSSGRSRTVTADANRPDVAALYPDQGPNHGFWVQWAGFQPGWHEVCIVAVNRGNGQNTDLGCRSAVVPDAQGRTPTADIWASSPGPGAVDVNGWGRDMWGNTAPVGLTVDNAWRRDVDGSNIGTRLSGITGGAHLVCAWVGGIRTDCAWVGVAGSNPVGRLDGIAGGNGVITTSGWAYDPETLDPIITVMIVDGVWYSGWASRSRPEFLSTYPGYGDVHGFALGVPMSPGTHWTCVAALNHAHGVDTMLGCQNVVVK